MENGVFWPPEALKRLSGIWITTAEQLVVIAATDGEMSSLAEQTGLSSQLLAQFVNRTRQALPARRRLRRSWRRFRFGRWPTRRRACWRLRQYGQLGAAFGRVDRRQSVHGYRRPKLAASRSGTAAAPPPPWLSRAIRCALGLMARISWRISSGTIGLPPRHRDFHRQNKRNPARSNG